MRHEKGRPEAANPKSVHGDGQHDLTAQLDIFDAIATVESEARKASGMDASRYGEDVRIVAAVESAVRDLARTRETFTADDALPGLTSRRCVGAVFSKLARQGVIQCVGATTSQRADRHGGLTRVWSSADGGA